MANPEFKAIVKCTRALVGEIANNLDIADALFEEDLITDNVVQRLRLPNTKKDKAGEILECIRNKVNSFPKDVFPKFLEVLKKECSKELVEKLESKLGTS